MFCQIYSTLSNTLFTDNSIFAKFKLPNNDILYEAQRIYWTLKRFARRTKKYVIYSANDDLYGAPLIPKYTIELIQDNCVYKFSIHDLVKIIQSDLLTIVHGYPFPKFPRNPYINKDFNLYHIVSIYVFMWAYTPRLVYNPVLRAFYKADFDLHAFKENNQKMLASKCVEAMVPKDASVSTEILYDIVHMLKTYCNPFATLFISNKINTSELYKVFRAFLHLYYQHRLLHHDSTVLRKALLGFVLYNPMFGRDYYDYATKKYGVDTRHLCIRDCIYVSDVLAKSEANMLKPIGNVYYLPIHRHKLTRTVLTRVDRNEYINVIADTESS